MSTDTLLSARLGLIDAVDHLLDRGAVVAGRSTISLAGVDLVYLELNLLLASVETLQQRIAAGTAGTLSAPTSEPAFEALHPNTLPSRERGQAGPLSPCERELEGGVDPSPAASLLYGDSQPLPNPPPSKGREQDPLPTKEGDAQERPDKGLAQLVLTLVELLRQVVERQALRRMEGGSLPDDQLERMGLALMELEAKMNELRTLFDLEEGDINIDLGPLGKLL
jgi:hypothetical protein